MGFPLQVMSSAQDREGSKDELGIFKLYSFHSNP